MIVLSPVICGDILKATEGPIAIESQWELLFVPFKVSHLSVYTLLKQPTNSHFQDMSRLQTTCARKWHMKTYCVAMHMLFPQLEAV